MWLQEISSQANWRWCRKCQGLAFAGNPSPGACPAGGQHDHSGSGNYHLPKDYGGLLLQLLHISSQENWRWCNKCQGLAFAGNPSPGACPAGGQHDPRGQW
jgi:rubrerythrin